MDKLIVFVLFLAQFGFTQKEKIYWKEGEKLAWSDFKANPNKNHPFDAITYSGISYRFSAKTVENKLQVKYEVTSYFAPNKSWVKPKSINDLELLAHEQLHFDITELYARKLLQKLDATHFTKNAKTQIKTIYKSIAAERERVQKQYDAETNHSENVKMQKKWEIKIANQLRKLQKFATQ